jgi:hypothetical protein
LIRVSLLLVNLDPINDTYMIKNNIKERNKELSHIQTKGREHGEWPTGQPRLQHTPPGSGTRRQMMT